MIFEFGFDGKGQLRFMVTNAFKNMNAIDADCGLIQLGKIPFYFYSHL